MLLSAPRRLGVAMLRGAAMLVSAPRRLGGATLRGAAQILSAPGRLGVGAARFPSRPRRVGVGAPRLPSGSRRVGAARLLVAAAVVGVALIAVVLVSAPNRPSAGQVLNAASSGPLTVRYGRTWHAASGPVPGQFALAAGTGARPAIALASGTVTLAGGVLGQSAAVPGGVPPQLGSRYGGAANATTTQVAGHAARRYDWTLPGARHLVAFVLPTSGSDVALVCAEGVPAADALTACEDLARGAEVSGVTVRPPGPDALFAAVLRGALAPVAEARGRLNGLGGGSLRGRASAASSVAAAERAALSALTGGPTPARDASALAALRGALTEEGAAFAAVAAAASADNRPAYAAARLRAIAASAKLRVAGGLLIGEGFAPPPLPAVYLLPPPALPKPSAAPAPVVAPVLQPAPATAVAAPPAQVAPPTYQPPITKPPTSTPPASPTVVTVPTSSARTSHGSTPPSRVVVVPTR
jgi:hypothetical protein